MVLADWSWACGGGCPAERRVSHLLVPTTVTVAVDIDRYMARNEPGWTRLEHLTAEARRGVGRLSPAGLHELVQLYQRVSSQLSYVRTYYRDSPLTARLTRIVASANGVVYGKRARTFTAITDFFLWTFPGAVWKTRRAILWSAVVFFGVAA